MKITHIITTLVYGGAEKLLSNFTKIHAEKHDVEIIYFKGNPDIFDSLHPKIKVTLIPLNLQILSNLRAYLDRSNPDIVHTHLGHADFLGLWASRKLQAKKFCTMHNIWFKWDFRDRIFFRLYSFLFKTISPSCKVISISASVKEHVDNVLKVKSENSILVYNAIPSLERDLNKEECRNELGIDYEERVILFVGRLRVQKSVSTLLYALDRVRRKEQKIKLLIVGAGELEQELRGIANSLQLEDCLSFEGVTSEPDKYMAAADIFVLPSIFEGLGLVILEAFRARLPVITTNIEGPKELIENRVNGMLIEPKNDIQLADRIEELLLNPSLRDQIGLSGFQTFTEKFTIEAYASRLELLYNEK